MPSPAPQPGAPPNLPPPPQHPLARPLRTSTAPHTMRAVCPGVAPGHDGAATLHAATSELGRVLRVPRRFVRQRLERPTHPRQQPGSMPLVASMCSAQGTHLNTLTALQCRVKHAQHRTHLSRGSELSPCARPLGASPPAVHRRVAVPGTSSATPMLL